MSAPKAAQRPTRLVLEGRYTRLEPLALRHAADVLAAAGVPDAAQRFAYVPDPPTSLEAMRSWIVQQQERDDPILFAVVDEATGCAGGWQQMLRIVPSTA